MPEQCQDTFHSWQSLCDLAFVTCSPLTNPRRGGYQLFCPSAPSTDPARRAGSQVATSAAAASTNGATATRGSSAQPLRASANQFARRRRQSRPRNTPLPSPRFRQDHSLHIAALRPECHANADLRVRCATEYAFTPDTDRRERQAAAEDAEHRCAPPADPKLDVLEMLGESLSSGSECRNRLRARSTEKIRRRNQIAACIRELDVEKTLLWNPPRTEDRACRLILSRTTAARVSAIPTTSICAPVGALRIRPTQFRKQTLAQRIAIGPKFVRQDFIDDRNRRSGLMHRFRYGEGAPAQQPNAHSLEKIRADIVRVRVERETFCRRRGPRVGRWICPSAANRLVQLDHAERDRRRNARALHSRQGRQPFLERPIKVTGPRLVVTRQTCIRFQKIIRACLQTGVDRGRLACTAEEKRRRRKERERERDLHHDQRIARQKSPAPHDCVFAGVFLQPADSRLRQLQRRPSATNVPSRQNPNVAANTGRSAAFGTYIDRQFRPNEATRGPHQRPRATKRRRPPPARSL